jgi:excisionase family DNA binding protein
VSLLTIKQVARELSISPDLVYDLVASGEIEGYKIRNIIRIDPLAVEAFKASTKITPLQSQNPVVISIVIDQPKHSKTRLEMGY